MVTGASKAAVEAVTKVGGTLTTAASSELILVKDNLCAYIIFEF